MERFNILRELVLATDNKACFIERERILGKIEQEMKEYDEPDRFAIILSRLLSEVSTPIHECDYFAGRVLEALPDKGFENCNGLLGSLAHLSMDYEKLLRRGFGGILEDIKVNADRLGDEESQIFAHNCEIIVMAIRDYANRYAVEAEKMGKAEMALALRRVPYEPAYDFYSALQSIWLTHMIASCYVGGRDYAFGRFDIYMLPFYEQALADGKSKAELTELLAGFLVKANEICGRAAHDYAPKPIPSNSSKQYLTLGGEQVNVFSSVILDAAMIYDMPQPQMTVLLKPEADEKFTEKVFEALSVLVDKLHVYNYDLVLNNLLRIGLPEDIAKEFTYSGCCTMDFHYHTMRREHYVPVPQIFVEALHKQEYQTFDEVFQGFVEGLRQYITMIVGHMQYPYSPIETRRQFGLDAMLTADGSERCRCFSDTNAPYNALNLFCPGIATVGDSLMVLDKLVFTDKEYSYREFMKILDENYENHEELRQRILSLERFGNDSENDKYTVMAANAFVNIVDSVKEQKLIKENFYAVGGFYSLNRDNRWRPEIAATPDGRKANDPISENQSPTYGADKKGITAMLKSVAKLPFDRASAGGLNVTFSKKVAPEILQALVLSYFELGGLHVGTSVIDRATLEDAMENPEKHKSLTVRVYGFSEYFTSLDEQRQLAVLNRTEYSI